MRAGIEIRLKQGWHTYWRYPGDAGVPPRFDFTGSQNVKSVEVLWPAPRRLPEAGLDTIGYDRDVILPLRVTPQDQAKPVMLQVKADYAICEKLCVPAQTKAGLALSRKLLVHRKNPNKQVFLITDGKPSAIWERGRLYKNPFGLDLKIVNRTLEEADACRRDGITITTFMIATDTYLVEFVDKLTKVNRGRAYYASPHNLAEFLFTDYIRNRKKFLH